MRLLRLLPITLLACGGSTNHLADSGRADAEPIDAASGGTVAVAVTVDGAPASGVQVYFQNLDSTLVAGGSAVTDAGGSASATMVAGGFVTVLQPMDPDGATPGGTFVDNTALDTFTGVKPGDVLHIDIGSAPGSDVTSVVNLTVPVDLAANVAKYKLEASCSGGERDITPGSGSAGSGDNNPPVTVSLVDCLDGKADIVIASADAGNNLIDFIYAPGVAVGSDAGSGIDIAITGSYAPVPVLTEAVGDLEPGTVGVDVFLSIATPSTPALADVYGIIGGASALGSAALGSASVALQVPTIPGGVATTSISIDNGSAFMDTQQVLVWAPSPATATAVDYEGVQVKDITSTPVYDPSTNTITWSSGTLGAAPDFVYGTMSVARADGSAEWTWQVAGPGVENGAIVLPSLPTDVFDFNFEDGDADGIGAIEVGTVPGGYDAVRGLLLPDANFDVDTIVPATSGQVVVANYFGPIGAGVQPGRARRVRMRR